MKQNDCLTCGGTGELLSPKPKPCGTCRGTGQRPRHPQWAETRSFFSTLFNFGLRVVELDDGGGRFGVADKTLDEQTDEALAADECHVYVQWSTGRKAWIYLVYGNGPGELASDYGIPQDTPEMCRAMDAATEEHSKKWENIDVG